MENVRQWLFILSTKFRTAHSGIYIKSKLRKELTKGNGMRSFCSCGTWKKVMTKSRLRGCIRKEISVGCFCRVKSAIPAWRLYRMSSWFRRVTSFVSFVLVRKVLALYWTITRESIACNLKQPCNSVCRCRDVYNIKDGWGIFLSDPPVHIHPSPGVIFQDVKTKSREGSDFSLRYQRPPRSSDNYSALGTRHVDEMYMYRSVHHFWPTSPRRSTPITGFATRVRPNIQSLTPIRIPFELVAPRM